LGFIFSRLDSSLLEQIVHLLAKLFFVFPSRRKETLISNLRYAFPEWSNSKVRRVARISTERMLEMGFFSLTYPFMGKERWRKSVQYSAETEQRLTEFRRSKAPVLFLLPHFSLLKPWQLLLIFVHSEEKNLVRSSGLTVTHNLISGLNLLGIPLDS